MIRPGTRLGSYEVQAPLGAGGMGEVYRARDTKLGRDVAIKILPAEYAADRDRLSRFEREARLLASLNHPHIATIHGVVEEGGVTGLVMELVDGPTLAERLKQGSVVGAQGSDVGSGFPPTLRSGETRRSAEREGGSRTGLGLAIDEALEVARQIAEALDAAHEKGIVHRDLKPDNVKLTKDGAVKVLDFGLATALAPAGMDASVAATRTQLSQVGTIAGTAAYMSPEQARGLVVDKRTDIWAFGCVLYEMLAGRPVYEGATASDVLARVIEREPDWSGLPASTPARVRRLLERCLEKDVKRRLRDIGDAVPELVDDRDSVRESEPGGRRLRPGERIAWAAALVLTAIAAGVLAVRGAGSRPPPGPEMRLEITTPQTMDPVSMALSPDGRQLVFVADSEGRSRLWLRPIDTGTAHVLAGTDNAAYPFFSPDGKSIGFFGEGSLNRIDLEDGSVRRLARVGLGGGGAWSPDGTILFTFSPGSPLMQVAAGGGPATPATRVELPQQIGHGFPQFLPDGRHFLCYVRGTPESRGIYVGQLGSPEVRRLTDAESAAVFNPTGHLIFVRQDTLVAQGFDPDRLALVGSASAIGGQVITDLRRLPALSASSALLAFRAGTWTSRRQFVWIDRAGRELEKTGMPDSNFPMGPALSPDGRRVAVHRLDLTTGGTGDLWVLEMARGVFSPVTRNPAQDIFPTWSPDGTRLLFASNRAGVYDLYVALLGGGPEQLVLKTPASKIPTDWSRNGLILYNDASPTGSSDITALPIDGDRKPVPVATSSANERDGQWSPDGKWIAFQSDESGRFEVYVQPFPGPGSKAQISNAGGTQVRWRADSRELFYIALDGQLMSVPMVPGREPQSIEPGKPTPLFATHIGGAMQQANRPHYMVSPDGQRFLMNTLLDEPIPPITLLVNWRPRPQ